ncbi:MAG: CdaR family protein [Bacillota bacterium]|nr:CdaR family protein [Bacillota bacterium]MDW7684528.1 CdaR family protein [Bacillota bacterium]
MMERLLKNNTAVKVFAFFLALMLWVYVTSDVMQAGVPDETRPYRNVPLAWHNLEEGRALMDIPDEVDVSLRGRPDVLDSLTPQNMNVFVDLRGLEEGRHNITPQVEVPRGVRVMSIEPQQVIVELEGVESPQKPVTLEIIGAPADGYVMGDPRILPDSVFVRGPRSLVNSVDSVRAVVNIDGAESDRVQVVPLKVVDAVGRELTDVTVNPDMVEVLIPFSEPQKRVPIRVPLLGEPAEGYQVQQVNVNPSTVTVQGREEDLAGIEEVLTGPVNIADVTETVTVEMLLISPDEAQILHSGTVSIEIIIAAE